MRTHIRSIRVLVWTAVLAVLALVLAFVPLMGVLGFEFSFVMAIVGSLASIDLGAAFVRRLRMTECPPLERATDPARLLLSTVLRAALVNLALLALPLAIISLNAFRVRNCDWWFGIEAYALLPVLSSLAATTTGVLVGLATGERKKLSNALPFAIVLGSLLLALWTFYSEPPIFSYNIFAGYYPGSFYDEGVALGAPLYWSRLLQLAVLLLLASAAVALVDVPSLRIVLRSPRRPGGLRWRAMLVAVVSAVAAAVIWSDSAHLGFDIDAEDIQRELGGRYETDHFVIYFPPGGEIERDIETIAEEHEFRYAQVTRTLGVEVPKKIVSYYFATPEDKARLMGAKRVYMAKPWRNEIYLNHYPFPHPVLRHELAHVVAGVFGDPIFHVSVGTFLGLPIFFNVGLIEGLAVATDWPDRRTQMTPHQAVRAMMELGVAPPVDRIFSTGFLAFSSARSYTLAGSFVRFLLDTRGAARLRILYRSGGDFSSAYGESRQQLTAEWQAMLETIEMPPDAAEIVRERFRRPSIFARPCPHAIARQRERAAYLVGRGRLREAIATMQSVCSHDRGEPRHRLELARLLRRRGAVDEAELIFSEISANATSISSTLRAEALMQLASIAVERHDLDEAARVLEQAAGLPLDEDTERNVRARLFAVRHTGAAGAALRSFFWDVDQITGFDAVVLAARASEAIAAEPDLGMGYYLLGRVLRSRGAPADATRLLESALETGLPHPLLTRECARLLAASAYLADDPAALLRAVAVLTEPEQPLSTRLRGQDWRERIYWKRTGSLPPAE